jgi:hypothetical protein
LWRQIAMDDTMYFRACRPLPLLILLLTLVTATVDAVSASAKRVEINFTLVTQTPEAVGSLGCPSTISHVALRTYDNVNLQTPAAKTDAILFRNLLVDGSKCTDTNSALSSTIFEDVAQSPAGTPVQAAEPFFLRGLDNSARRCGSFSADLPNFYFFTDNLPAFREVFEGRRLIPVDDPALSGANKSDIFMFSQPFPSGQTNGDVVFSAVCTFIDSRAFTSLTTTTAAAPFTSTKKSSNRTTAMPSAVPIPPRDDNGGSACFPASATVAVRSAPNEPYVRVRMDDLHIGMSVQVSQSHDSDVFLFTHRLPSAYATYVTLTTGFLDGKFDCGIGTNESHSMLQIEVSNGSFTNSITLSPGHLIYTHQRGLIAASAVRPGDCLLKTQPAMPRMPLHPSYNLVHVIQTTMNSSRSGLYAPHTLNGDIVVNDFLVSTYTSALHPTVAHAGLAPVRGAYRMRGWAISGSLDAGFPQTLITAARHITVWVSRFILPAEGGKAEL